MLTAVWLIKLCLLLSTGCLVLEADAEFSAVSTLLLYNMNSTFLLSSLYTAIALLCESYTSRYLIYTELPNIQTEVNLLSTFYSYTSCRFGGRKYSAWQTLEKYICDFETKSISSPEAWSLKSQTMQCCLVLLLY